MLVRQEMASTCMPQWAATRIYGTVDMPTASAPTMRAMRIYAGVSKLGPRNHMYTP